MDIFGLGLPELLLILFVILLFFGKDKLPELAHSLGRSVKELREGFDQGTKEKHVEMKEEVKKDDN